MCLALSSFSAMCCSLPPSRFPSIIKMGGRLSKWQRGWAIVSPWGSKTEWPQSEGFTLGGSLLGFSSESIGRNGGAPELAWRWLHHHHHPGSVTSLVLSIPGLLSPNAGGGSNESESIVTVRWDWEMSHQTKPLLNLSMPSLYEIVMWWLFFLIKHLLWVRQKSFYFKKAFTTGQDSPVFCI